MAHTGGSLRGVARGLSTASTGNESLGGGTNIEIGRSRARRRHLPLQFCARLQKGSCRSERRPGGLSEFDLLVESCLSSLAAITNFRC